MTFTLDREEDFSNRVPHTESLLDSLWGSLGYLQLRVSEFSNPPRTTVGTRSMKNRIDSDVERAKVERKRPMRVKSFIDGIIRRRSQFRHVTEEPFGETRIGQSLAWLADAPLFIDAPQVEALYNAVVKPEYKEATVKISLKALKSLEVSGEGGGEASIGTASWLKTIFPFLDVGAKVSTKAAITRTWANEGGNEVELHPIDTPQRQLVQLALHYMANVPRRLSIVRNLSQTDWLEHNFISGLPRALVFVDFPPQTRFIPMAAELEDGSVKLIYPSLAETLTPPGTNPPKYEDLASSTGEADRSIHAHSSYWDFFKDHFSPKHSMEAIEETLKGGLARWIDYRVPVPARNSYLHLHVQGLNKYATGTFAYSLVKRGFEHGLRIIGTMKSEPGMNVLAIFEK